MMILCSLLLDKLLDKLLNKKTIIAALLLLPLNALAQTAANDYRGLWVGQVVLNYVNEVSVPLDANNVAIAPDPEVPTPTADQAQLRLILHVNSIGQVNLLKEVAVLNRSDDGSVANNNRVVNLLTDSNALNARALPQTDSDLALVSDARLYDELPSQPALRVASVVFDFGDHQPTAALDAVVDAAVNASASSVQATAQDLSTVEGRQNATNAAFQQAQQAAQPVVDNADVANNFSAFLDNHFTSAEVDAIAANDAATQALRDAADALQRQSFYNDERGVQMVDAVVAAVQAETDAAAKPSVAHHVAASFADTADNYHRFIAGKQFGDMIRAAATTAATAAIDNAATADSIRAAVDGDTQVNATRARGLDLRINRYQDNRYAVAIDTVVNAIVDSAAALLPVTAADQLAVQSAAEQAGRDALAQNVARLPTPSARPSIDYTEFVRANTFQQSVDTAAQAAAAAAVIERRDNALWTLASLQAAARVAAAQSLSDNYAAAARAVRTELALDGTFATGQGDPRLRYDIAAGDAPLGAGALNGTIFLPARHPTNPFRHRRHPDHTSGFALERRLRLDFDGNAGDPLTLAGFGVDRISGSYREEIFGLHKPLGPNQDIGLRVEGRFTLQRVSLIDTLNAL